METTVDQSHLVLARKYRPQKFAEVVQQQTAVRALLNAIEGDRLGSAYLFFGPRGVGKTTIARILAKRVNCTAPQGGEPCDACESCLSIVSGNSLDVMEIDAASHRGIHHIRELRENVKFQPMVSRIKVYIIDEVHMLTTESFNALLKTLEEPPAHVLFILATTELNKIPETILSRCQVFNFRKVPLKVVQEYLRELCAREKIEADDEALFWIARRGDGSVRDSLSFMEQAITFCDGKLETEKVKELIGAIALDLFIDLTQRLLEPDSDGNALLTPIHEIFNSGGDLNRFVWEYLDFLRILIHIKQKVENPEFLGIPGGEIKRMHQEFDGTDPVRLTVIFNAVYALLTRSFALRLRNSYEMRVLIEIEILALHEKLQRPSIAGVLKKLNQFSAALKGGTPYSPEFELQKQFLGTVMDPDAVPSLENEDESV
ncbi:MAG: DNA polymerase III subunit gamma/tau [Leptospiraceae bacterium]|nr:DNA polymerase III subunit gamma/tau [Leptospiraceae bacterium]